MVVIVILFCLALSSAATFVNFFLFSSAFKARFGYHFYVLDRTFIVEWIDVFISGESYRSISFWHFFTDIQPNSPMRIEFCSIIDVLWLFQVKLNLPITKPLRVPAPGLGKIFYWRNSKWPPYHFREIYFWLYFCSHLT